MTTKKVKTSKVDQVPQPKIKVSVNAQKYVSIEKYFEIMAENAALFKENIALQKIEIALRQKERSSTKAVINYEIDNYKPFCSKTNLALN